MKLVDYYRQTVYKNDNFLDSVWSTYYYGVLSKVINENNYKIVAEVGIGYGTHAKHILKNTNIDRLYLIDPVKEYEHDYFSRDIMKCEANTAGNNFNELFELIQTELSPMKEKVTFLRKESIFVTNEEINNGSLDCAFIDANHEYKYVLEDLLFWWDKIKIGGQMLGDDYYMDDVAKAVQDFANKLGLTYDFLYKEGTDYKIFRFKKEAPQKKWALVLLANEGSGQQTSTYISRAFNTIMNARKIGEWKDDIVLLVSSVLFNSEEVKETANMMNVILREVPNRNFDTILDVWKKHRHSSDEDLNYVLPRGFMYNKFHVFNIFFKKWEYVFYIDAGMHIHYSMERFKIACKPSNCIYAHSDAYPMFEWKLKRQFCMDLFDTMEEEKELVDSYNLNVDYFQGTMFIFDTNIIKPTTVDRLFYLSEKYPVTMRMDQGILNLYFTCERKLWKQIPIKDSIGFLYDFRERDGYKGRDYAMLKYPRFNY
jgi:hypothetical protein